MNPIAIAPPLDDTASGATPGTVAAPRATPANSTHAVPSLEAQADTPGADTPTAASTAQRLEYLLRRVPAGGVPVELLRALYAHRGVAP